MPRKINVVILIALYLISCSVILAQKKALTNNDIVKMVKAGLAQEIIIEAIKSSEQNFDVSADALIALKQQGIPDAVIQAMVAKTRPSSESQPASGGVSQMPEDVTANVMLIDGSNKMPLKRATAAGGRSGGVGMKVLNPFGKIKYLQTFNGSNSLIRTNNTSPTFEVMLPDDLNASDAIALIKFDVKSDRREISTARGRFGASSGFSKDDLMPITIDELQSQISRNNKAYKVTLVKPIKKGEYALVIHNAVFYDFGVDSSN